MSLVQVAGEDAWLKEYEFSECLVRNITQATVRRRRFKLGDVEHASLTGELRKQILQAEHQLATLLNALEYPSKDFSQVAPGETERRQRLVETLQSSLKKSADEFYQGLPQQGPFTKVADLGTVNWGEDDETESSINYSNAELRQHQLATVDAQEEALAGLSIVVRNQRRIAKTIESEVADQDDLLIDIKERVGSTQNNLEQQTAHVTEVTRKSSTFGYWVIIILLLIAIVIVAVW